MRGLGKISISIFLSWYFLPAARAALNSTLAQYVMFSFFILWALCCSINIINSKKMNIKIPAYIIIIVIQMVLFLVFILFGLGNAKEYIKIGFTFWIPMFVFAYYKMFDIRFLKTLGLYFLVLYIITALTTYIGLINDPFSARILVDSSTDFTEDLLLMKKNMGDMYFIQMSVLFIPIYVSNLFFKNKMTLNIILITLTLIFIVSASFTIALLVFVFSVVISIFAFCKSRVSLTITSIGLVLLFFLLNNGEFFINLGGAISNQRIRENLIKLGEAFKLGELSIASTRWNLYSISFKTFLNNITGIGPYYFVSGIGIGNHSQILDDLARYGIVMLFMQIVFFVSFFRNNNYDNKTARIFISVLLTYIMFLFLNPGFRSQYEAIVVFLIIPTFLYSRSSIKNIKRERLII